MQIQDLVPILQVAITPVILHINISLAALKLEVGPIGSGNA